MYSLFLVVGTLAVAARASYDSKPFDNLVTFGDSYTVSSFPETMTTSLATEFCDICWLPCWMSQHLRGCIS